MPNEIVNQASTIIGKRVQLPPHKGLRITCIVLMILSVILTAVAFCGLWLGEDTSTIVIFIALSLSLLLLSVIMYLLIRKVDNNYIKVKDIPAIVLNGDDTLTLNLGNGTSQSVNVADISGIKFTPRTTATFLGLFMQYAQQEDGTVSIKLHNGTSYKVAYVDNGSAVVNSIQQLINK